MKKVQIQFNENMSKAEELQAWKSFYENLPAGSYLEMTLKGLSYFVENNIENDFGINVMDTYNARENQVGDLMAQVRDLEKKLESKDASIATAQGLLKTKDEQLQAGRDEREDIRDKWYNCIENNRNLKHQLQDTENQYTDLLAAKDEEITKLKAKLYDLMVKGE